MKFIQTFTIEIQDLDVLNLINEEQEFNDLEVFQTLEEIPDHLITLYLNENPAFEDIFYDSYAYDSNKITFLR